MKDARDMLAFLASGCEKLAGDMKGILAKSISYPDPATFVISLYPEAHWQDGKPLTADDVVYTLQLAKTHNDLNYAPGYHTPNDTPDRVDPAALDRAHGFALELVRALDRDVGRRSERVTE